MHNKIIYITIILTSLLVGLSPAFGQIVYEQPGSGDIKVVYSHWSLEDTSGTLEINQLTIPFTGFIPLQDNLEAFLYVANSSNKLESSNTDYSLSGLGDVRLQLNRSFNDDQLLLSVGVNLPTGKKKLNRDEELLVLQMLTQNYLSFPMRRFGEGFGFNVLFGGARMIGELRCGAGVMYQYNGEYEPYEGTGKYDPGDFVSVNAGADWQKDDVTLTGDVIFTSYMDDKLDGDKVFKQSTQLDWRLGAAYNGGNYDLNAGISYLLRGRNSIYTTAEELKIFGNEFRINGNLKRYLQRGWQVAPSAELRLIGANDQGFGGSTIFSFGGAVGKTLGEQIAASVGGRYFTGNANDGAIDLSGFQLTANLTAKL